MPDDYGYFGKGTTGYVHYKQAFDRNFGGSGGGGGSHHNGGGPHHNGGGGGDGDGCGCLFAILAAVVLFVLLILANT